MAAPTIDLDDSDSGCELVPSPPPSRETVMRHLYKPDLTAQLAPRKPEPGVATELPSKLASAAARQQSAKTASKPPGLKALFQQRREERQEVAAKPKAKDSAQSETSNASEANFSISALLVDAGVQDRKAALIAVLAAKSAKQRQADPAEERKRWRSLVWNLRHNPALVEKVNSGETKAKDLLEMSVEDLAESEIKQKRRKLQAEALSESIVRNHTTYAIVCVNCGGEAQGSMINTRGNLEDDGWGQMSLRGCCSHCGHVWVDGKG
eukprot:TRINITY_DN25309_c0_g1_i1.p1 TRINITY_DN25309_c0_g1~~TRINITY_DN25309_c0_g1_i1.p1  ORF type:complete len:283 (+),score=62.81 TRINITY_DN25309_c0_g1_i1:52-849(+)